ncbi:hypothetical protein AN1V17_16490 [Vallitalea sediminicola]
MLNFDEYIFNKVKDEIDSWNDSLIEDIYVISFCIENINDDYRLPTVTLGYNTISNVKEVKVSAGDFEEARWNYAFWLQNRELVIGDIYNEINDADKVRGWIKEQGLYFTDEEESKDFDRIVELGEKIIIEFVDIIISVVQKLHSENVIKDKFKRDIPLIIHELEYYDEIAEQNIKANPNDVINEFVEWVKNQ